jgi:hypothetical protein
MIHALVAQALQALRSLKPNQPWDSISGAGAQRWVARDFAELRPDALARRPGKAKARSDLFGLKVHPFWSYPNTPLIPAEQGVERLPAQHIQIKLHDLPMVIESNTAAESQTSEKDTGRDKV